MTASCCIDLAFWSRLDEETTVKLTGREAGLSTMQLSVTELLKSISLAIFLESRTTLSVFRDPLYAGASYVVVFLEQTVPIKLIYLD